MNTILLIFLLFLVLAILVILNHIEFVSTNTNTSTNTSTSQDVETGQMVSAYDNIQGTCADTHFGCCPDGVNSKDNIFGSNCPTYKETQ